MENMEKYEIKRYWSHHDSCYPRSDISACFNLFMQSSGFKTRNTCDHICWTKHRQVTNRKHRMLNTYIHGSVVG
jgi:hypothetical protein